MRSYIVTGGASGIGRATAVRLAAAGHGVTIVDRDDEGAAETLRLIQSAGQGRGQIAIADVGDEREVAASVEAAVVAFGGLDGAVNAAAVETNGKQAHELSLEEWERHIRINLTGMFLCIKHQLAVMVAGGKGGAIVAISSVAAIKGMPGSIDYCASKAGVTGLVRSVALDYGQHDIRINALLPGRTDTPMLHRIRRNVTVLSGARHIPLERAATPEEMADNAIWLLSDSASYISGACISVDGGLGIA